MLQVYWGLLACEILLGKSREVIEKFMKKMKDLIERKYAEDTISEHEHLQLVTWMLHWMLVYSFTATDVSNTCLFATILTEQSTYGNLFLDIIQKRPNSLIKFMISAILLAGSKSNQKHQIQVDSLQKLAIPIVNETIGLDDSFSRFVRAVYRDVDFDQAAKIAVEMEADAKEDILLSSYASEIKKQAQILIFQQKSKLYHSLDIAEVTKTMDKSLKIEEFAEELQRHLQSEGLQVRVEKGSNSVVCT